MAQIIAGMNDVISEHVAEIALEVVGHLVDNPPTGTPIDTAWASVNWWVRAGGPPTGNDGRGGNVSSAQNQQQAGIASIASYHIGGGESIWITNNTPYIKRLNMGSSEQSPAGFVEAAIKLTLDENRRKRLN